MNLELFSCAGGMAMGFLRAGIVFDLVVDKSPEACDSYERNIGHRPVQMDAQDLLRMVEGGWRPEGGVDLLVADPPCTPWSRAGKRLGLEDERDMLAVTCRLIHLLAPTRWLIGNVPGLEDSSNRPAVASTIGTLSAYWCVSDCCLDAADFGVPQHRIRPFWYGHPKGEPSIRWPAPTHCEPGRCGNLLPGHAPMAPWVTVREALAGLSPAEMGRPVSLRFRGAKSEKPAKAGKRPRASVEDRPAGVVTVHENGDGNVLVFDEHHPPSWADEPAKCIRAGDGAGAVRAVGGLARTPQTARLAEFGEPARAVLATSRPHVARTLEDRHPINQPDAPASTIAAKQRSQGGCLLEWPWDRPSSTVTADPNGRIAPPGHMEWGTAEGGSTLSMPGAVVLSERAAAILQGFPDGWHFAGATKRSRWSQIGQAMPPALAHAVALAIVRQSEQR
jgi:site-specific DNA-cytosine methylase